MYHKFFLTILILFLNFNCAANSHDPIKTDFKNLNLQAKYINYNYDLQIIEASDAIEIHSTNYILKADKLIYNLQTDELTAEGNILMYNDNTVIHGNYVILKDNLKTGIINNLILHLPDDVTLKSREAVKYSVNSGVLLDSSYTSCPTCDFQDPMWQIKAKQTNIDFDKQQIIYRNAFFEVYGIPVLYVPYFSHPTPSADAKSGILLPSITDGSIKLPLYYRPKADLDFTLTPRIMRHKLIYESQFRHLLNNGSYKIDGSLLKDNREKIQGNKDLSTAPKSYRYHLNSSGNFNYLNELFYGFDYNTTSDKSYMKNYNYGSAPILTSKLYGDKLSDNNYVATEVIKFQGLRDLDSHLTDPIIHPHLTFSYLNGNRSKNINNLSGDILMYSQPNGERSNRASIKLLQTHKLLENEHKLNISLYLRSDLCSNTKSVTNFSNPYLSTAHTTNAKSKSFFIPQQLTEWQFNKLYYNSSNQNFYELEPKVLLVIAEHNNSSKRKFINIDSENIELKDDNLFTNNRYSGIDQHEYGSKISYGCTLANYNSNNLKKSFFIGQLVHIDNKSNYFKPESGLAGKWSNVVGNFNIELNKSKKIFYKFTQDPKIYKNLKSELGLNLNFDKIDITMSYVAKKNYDFINENHHIRQANLLLSYQYSKSIIVSYNTRFDLSTRSIQKIIDYGVNVTYIGDCVKIQTGITNNYSYDPKRGITKNRSTSFVIGLKTLSY